MLGGISEHPHRPTAELMQRTHFDISWALRHSMSDSRETQETQIFNQMCRYCANRRGGPLGAADLLLTDDDGVGHVFHFETFYNQHDALTLALQACQQLDRGRTLGRTLRGFPKSFPWWAKPEKIPLNH